MRAVVQRVTRARVCVDNKQIAGSGTGLVVLLAVAIDDAEVDASWTAGKLASLRVFAEPHGGFERDVREVGGAVMLISQFTLLGDCRKGRRPSFSHAAAPAHAEQLYERVGALLRERGVAVQYGRFGAHMQIELVNDGPVTLILDSRKAP